MFGMRERLRATVVMAAMLAACLAVAATASAAATLTPGGSVQQVYVTGARAGERVALVNQRGATVAVLPAGSLGGVIFRGVRPGPGYRVRPAGGGAVSHAVTVMPDRSAPPSTKIYGQRIPSSGYGYLTTRDGTKLAIDVRLPVRPRAVPDADRVFRIRLRRPGRRGGRDQPDRECCSGSRSSM